MSVAKSSSSFIVGGDVVDVLDLLPTGSGESADVEFKLSPPKLILIPTYV